MPLPGTRVIHRDWSRHHRPTANGQMTATGTIARPASATTVGFDEDTGRATVPDPDAFYDGPIRVQRLAPALSSQAVTVGDREVVIREYQVSVPLSLHGVDTGPFAVNDIVTITVCPDDPDLIGQRIRVRDVRLGSLAWERDLLCEDIAATAR